MYGKRKRPILRKLANACTDFRITGGNALADRIVDKGPEFRSWRIAAFAGALLLTDKVDGILGRASNIPSAEYAAKDSAADKLVYGRLMTAIGSATSDKRYYAYNALTDLRDGFVDRKRAEMKEHGLDTTSRFPGKLKTTMQSIGLVADLSPFGRSHPKSVHAIHVSALAMAAYSGAEIIMDANQQLSGVDLDISADSVYLREEMQIPNE
jgi:phosphatidylglycerophosphate synthase